MAYSSQGRNLRGELFTILFSGNGAGDNQAATSDRAAWARQKVL